MGIHSLLIHYISRCNFSGFGKIEGQVEHVKRTVKVAASLGNSVWRMLATSFTFECA